MPSPGTKRARVSCASASVSAEQSSAVQTWTSPLPKGIRAQASTNSCSQPVEASGWAGRAACWWRPGGGGHKGLDAGGPGPWKGRLGERSQGCNRGGGSGGGGEKRRVPEGGDPGGSG